MYKKEKDEIIKAGIKLDRYGLIVLSGGNVSLRVEKDKILVTPSGMIYEEMVTDDIILMDLTGNIIEGKRKASVDTKALLYIYNNMTDVKAIIHTHQPYATALGLIQDEFKCNLTTLANATKGSVKVCSFSSAASEQMGIEAVENLNGKLAVILKNHGVIAVGNSLKQALYSCVYLEEAAKTYCIAKSMSDNIAMMTDKQIEQAVRIFDYYGQGKEEVPEFLVNQ
ncbi:class II aldolase/adducin family protein [Acidilutibacter cellobiosedens]|jgi:L-ribulose-5-phosphate 4-epimerase|uniref:Class II aldolase/adducin family protein n=1 Tax=Acidilutibacter cellobiosedens TaxID=2507161 RepID=A0A410Q9Y6_9FIRM|nr:class II aldolase/adducin family protein [Acidilutibacter cellobiosedens]MBE6081552.1 class II aldolase/adducin family protein [Tissierellaceae bacterium]QAT60812.1 class II aldolase/adducin family protein [Acidilutibacter cellobiosedens]